MFATLRCIFKRVKKLETKSHCTQECRWSGTLGFYWCLHSSLTPTRLWNVYRQWASKKTVIMRLSFSVSESMLALCVPNHINYLSGCRDPPLGICCTSLPEHPGSVAGSLQREDLVFDSCRWGVWRPSVEVENEAVLSVSSLPVLFWEEAASSRRDDSCSSAQTERAFLRPTDWTHSGLRGRSSGCTSLFGWGLNHFYGSSFLSDLAYKARTRKLQSSARFWIDKLWVGGGHLAFSPVTSLPSTSAGRPALCSRALAREERWPTTLPWLNTIVSVAARSVSVTTWSNQQIHGGVLGKGSLLEGGCLADSPSKNQITSRGASEIGSTVTLLREVGPWGLPK